MFFDRRGRTASFSVVATLTAAGAFLIRQRCFKMGSVETSLRGLGYQPKVCELCLGLILPEAEKQELVDQPIGPLPVPNYQYR